MPQEDTVSVRSCGQGMPDARAAVLSSPSSHGKWLIDLLNDRTYRIPPLSHRDVRAMVREAKSAPLLFGYRGAEPADVAAVESLISRVAQMQDDLPELSALELSLILVGTDGLSVLTASARVAPVDDPRSDSFVRRMTDVPTGDTIPG